MSRCTGRNQKFIDIIKEVVDKFDNTWDIKVYYDGGPYSNRDYVLRATVVDWSGIDTVFLKKALRDAGATNIIGGKRIAPVRDYIDFAFDIKLKLIGKLC